MSETKNLKLFKHNEPLETNENQFNIKKALHDNWDKLDEFAGKVNDKVIEMEDNQEQHDTDLQAIKQEQQEQNSKIENNTTQNEEQAELLNQIVNILPTAKGEGEYVTLEDTAEMKFKKFEVQGNSKQETRSGKNLLNIEKDFTITTFKEIKINLEPGTYTLSFESTESETGNDFSVMFRDNNTEILFRTINTNQTKKLTIQLNTKCTSINIYSGINYDSSENKTRTFKKMQIEKGAEATDYEEYGISPSPEYLSKIRNVGDNINLFDKNNANILNSAVDSNGIGINAGDTYKTIYIPCKANTAYTVSKIYDATKNRFALAYTNTEPTYNMQVEGYTPNANTSNITITTGTNAKYLLAYIWIKGGTTTYKEMLNSIKIEEGTQATAYSLYNCGSVCIKIENADKTQSEENIFPFKEGQRLHKRDYLAEDGIHNVRKQIALDGTENYGQYNRGTTDFFGVALKVSDIKSGQTIMCNKLIEDGSKIYNTNGEAVGCLSDNYLYICIKRVRIGATINTTFEECLELFKQYLTNCYNKGEPFIIEYGLTDEEIDTYTPEQQEAYNKLKKLHSYNEQTNIFSKDEISPIFNVEAIKNLNATFAQLSATMLERS